MNAKPQRRSLLLRLLVAAIAIIVAVLAGAISAPPNRPPGRRRARTGPRVKRERAARRRRRGAPMSPVQAATATTRRCRAIFPAGHRHRRQYRDRHQPGRWPADGDPLYRRPAGQSRRSAGGNRSPAVQVQLTRAQGSWQDQATLANARRDLARYQQLVKTNLVSRQELDTQASLVQQTEGAIKADQGRGRQRQTADHL